MPTLYLLVFISVILGAFGQVAMKSGMNAAGAMSGPGLALVVWLARAVFTPLVFLGLTLYAVSAGFWLIVLKQAKELSYVYPFIASGYVIILFLSALFFHEKITAVRSLGVVLICIGVAFVAKS